MVDLSKATFIIPLRIESADRMRNIITLLCFLLGNFDTNVIVKEVRRIFSICRGSYPTNTRIFGERFSHNSYF
jgi:hypothetical protein